ncbi:membrane-spanning 4-domains subfamily A member 18 [Ornithorhynchus anatinus]|uniref:membrane-spanning 4-domains subfamily A member 18 n=1 Tax=Ornithorhynchus anatinus TaxID=9258 RepID=UPI0019D4BDB6|nr:membrane-spanning 4-domains subfamily A member 18 [Ornithorhynchus anatinus]
MTSAGTSSGFGANEVPVVIAPSNVRVIQHGHPVVTGGFGQPVGMGNLQSVQVIDPNIRVIQPGHLQVSEGLGQPLGMGNLKTSGDQSSPGPNPGLHNSGYQFRGANPGFSTFPSFDIREFVNQEVRTLGAIQIMIGLIQVGFGSTEACFVNPNSLAFWGGYPYWGGLSFIISGSLSVSAAKSPNPCRVNGSVGMNITSAVFSLAGMVLHLTDLILISSKIPPVQCHNEIQCYLYIQKYYPKINHKVEDLPRLSWFSVGESKTYLGPVGADVSAGGWGTTIFP